MIVFNDHVFLFIIKFHYFYVLTILLYFVSTYSICIFLDRNFVNPYPFFLQSDTLKYYIYLYLFYKYYEIQKYKKI
jgi:hypothetical protein